MEPVTLQTERLVLRPWRDDDRRPFAALNIDPIVMEHLPQMLDRTESDALVDRIDTGFARHGWGLWAVEVPDVAPFIGFVGLADQTEVLGRPCTEVGWRLAARHWGHGYAPEGATECLRFAFEELGLDEVVSFTVPANVRSQRVMMKIGLKRAGEFDHPRFEEGSRFRRHVLFSTRELPRRPPLEEGVTDR